MKRIGLFAGIALLAILTICAATVYAADVTCPICGATAYFTGNTKTDVSGKLLYEYQCNRFAEHKFWAVKK